ncbi:MAG: hypothetical protein EZS28_054631, partial [Streblomastix strix]
ISNSYFENITRTGNGLNQGVIQAFISSSTGILEIINTNFIDCKGDIPSHSQGGALNLAVSGNRQISIQKCKFQSCLAFDGAGICAVISTGGQLTVDGECQFIDCQGYGFGSGLYATVQSTNSQLILNDGLSFERCICERQGGGLYISSTYQGAAYVNKVTFDSCKSPEGGGIDLYSSYNTIKQSFIGTQFISCNASKSGGGIYAIINGDNSA